MAQIVERYLPLYSVEQLYALAADIEGYPRFLSWCEEARVKRRDGNRLAVDNVFGLGPVRAHFETRAVLDPPHSIEVTSTDPPFARLRIVWRFKADPRGGCNVTLDLEQAFRSPLVQAAAQPFLAGFEEALVRAFIKRAREVYGPA